jgi:undecaprenyl phosphate N,N'-diacetylbacillosamine 1-phosphate transferase
LWYKREMRVQMFLKHILDVAGALAGLAVMAVPFFGIAVWIKLDSRGSVFFRQERVGKNEKPFRIYKFRTMTEGSEQQGMGYETAQDDPRITRAGGPLRRFGIDELPQFINVLQGDMSLVGPRTALPHQAAQFTKLEKRRFEVKPGIANLNILKGWNALPWKERIKWDIWYIDNWSLFLDLKILLFTFIIVLLGKGVYGGEKGKVEDYK